jgi:threonine dehydrogenase-like Zn-dependent dehydrogenase
VVGSWYGTKTANLHLGSNFHRNRLQIISSQVSTIAPGLRGRWNRARRFKTSWEMIRKVKPDSLITHQVPFNSAADAYQLLHESPAEVLQVVLVHQD